MSSGRHTAPRHAAAKGTANSGTRRATGGARKLGPTTSGRRVAQRPGAVAVIRAGSVGTLTAVAPFAVLGVACIVGLGSNPGEPASAQDVATPKPLAPASSPFIAAGKHRASTPTSVATDAIRPASVATSGSAGIVGPVEAIHHTTAPAPSAAPSSTPTATATPTPTVAPTPTVTLPISEPTETAAPLTEAEATAQCLADGVSALDVVGLSNCVTDLLNP